jgi:hypothetical protein
LWLAGLPVTQRMSLNGWEEWAPPMEPVVTQIEQIAVNNLIAVVKNAFVTALAGLSRVEPGVLEMDGMSGRKYRLFINNLIASVPNPRYLEVGSLSGSTLCAAMNGNAARAVAIDNWSEFGGPRDLFFANVRAWTSPAAAIQMIESDFRRVDYASLGQFNVFLFDGPHSAPDQYDGVSLALPALDDQFVLIVDDWNWEQVRSGTFQAIARVKLSILYGLEIRSTLDNSHPPVHGRHSDWHNGYFIAVLQQAARDNGSAGRDALSTAS